MTSQSGPLKPALETLFQPDEKSGALDGLVVLELADGKAHYCGRLLADLGADVYKIEGPGGSPNRKQSPFAHDDPSGPNSSLHFGFFNSNKRSVTMDLNDPGEALKFKELLKRADVLVETLEPKQVERWGLTYDALSALNPGLIVASVTGFGRSGPYKDFLAPDLVTYAMGGLMHQSGHPDYPPVVAPFEQSNQIAAILACYGILLALYERDQSGHGQHVEVSAYEVQAAQQHTIVNYASLAQVVERRGGQMGGGGAPSGIFQARDGFVHLHCMAPWMWRRLLDWIGRPEALADPVWDNRHFRALNADVIDPFVREYFVQFDRETLYREGQERHIPIAPVNSLRDFLDDSHVRSRGFFLENNQPEWGPHLFPGAPFHMSQTPWRLRSGPPQPGQHNVEADQLLTSAIPASVEIPPKSANPGPRKRPLEGIRVVDFTQALAGPFMTKILGEFGAEIIKVESEAHQQRGRSSPGLDPRVLTQQRVTWNDTHRNKLSVTADMNHSEARDLIARLIQECDVVVDNFSPRVLPAWGLDYLKVKESNPGVIMVSMPGFGMDGPDRDYVSVAGTVTALTGMTQLWGHPEYTEPVGSQTFQADYAAGAHAAVAVMAALLHKERAGEGQYIDQAQIESIAAVLGTGYLDASVNDRHPQPMGNSSPDFSPYGCYPCRDNRWCVIAVTSEEEWEQFRHALGNPGWTIRPEFETMAGRLKNREGLDQLIGEWTREYSGRQVMWILQRAGVAAGAVQNAEDLFYDIHLREVGFLVPLDDPDVGRVEYPGAVVHLSDTPAAIERAAVFGEHNERIFGEFLGLSATDMADLLSKGVLA